MTSGPHGVFNGEGKRAMDLTYSGYLDKILGGWIGKSIGGTVGARFEGNKRWIEIDPATAFPDQIPPNDDLDLQILWLSVLEQKGANLTSDDLAQAWLDGCWYPFNEYGNFRRNSLLGISPPTSGRYNNEFYESGMGCPIRSEIWGYVFPGAPDLAAKYAEVDGTLDHSTESVSAEKMLSAMAAMAFFVPDVRRLTEMSLGYLPEGSAVRELVLAAFRSYDEGLDLRTARERLVVLRGHPEACDSPLNVGFTFLGLLYGENDFEKTMLSALRCGYDTDCTLATALALLGQILGASKIPAAMKDPIGDSLVMGIQYRREEMTLSALARDTARVGALLSRQCETGARITGGPRLSPLPVAARVAPKLSLRIDYHGEPAAAPGEPARVSAVAATSGESLAGTALRVVAPAGWSVFPARVEFPEGTGPEAAVEFTLRGDTALYPWPQKNLFELVASRNGRPAAKKRFGIVGALPWQFLGVYFDPVPVMAPEGDQTERHNARTWPHHFVSFNRQYIEEAEPDIDGLYGRWSGIIGKPAVSFSKGNRLDAGQVTGLRGEYCAYFTAEVISPEDRRVSMVVGNNDGFKVWLNGVNVMESDEQCWFTPGNNRAMVDLKKGRNRVTVKLLKRGETLDFSLAFQFQDEKDGWPHHDWCTDLSWGNPLAG